MQKLLQSRSSVPENIHIPIMLRLMKSPIATHRQSVSQEEYSVSRVN